MRGDIDPSKPYETNLSARLFLRKDKIKINSDYVVIVIGFIILVTSAVAMFYYVPVP